jgi:nitroreductase
VFVLTRESDYHERYTKSDKLETTGGAEIEWPVPYWHVDAGAALMLILLAVIDEGLAAAVYGVQVEDQPKVRDLLRIPDELAIVAGITVGRPLPDPEWSKRTSRATQRRRALDELVSWNTWNS